MPRNNINNKQVFGPDCVFAVTDWANFIGNETRYYATITGTLSEVSTPFGTGLNVAVANSYVEFDWTSLAPLTTSPRTIFNRAYYPNDTGSYCMVSYGDNAIIRDAFLNFNFNGAYLGGFASDNDNGGAIGSPAWFTIACTNTGVNGGANIVYANGSQIASGTNGGNGVTTYTDLKLFAYGIAPVINHSPVGTILQEVLIFNRVLSALEIQNLHNACIGAFPAFGRYDR